MSCDIRNGDCLELMKTIPDKSVDLFICDLPYVDITGKGETNCKWNQDNINLDEFWKEFKRIRKSPRVACIHFCSTKFGYTLIKSWEKGYKMDMVWKKRNKTGGLQSRHRPMRNHEMVYFFYDQAPKYNRDKYHKRIQEKKEHNIEINTTYGNSSKRRKNEICFEPPNPVSVVEEPKRKSIKDRKGMGESSGIYSKENQTASSFEPPNPASVVEEKYTKEHLDNNRGGAGTNNVNEIFTKENQKEWNKTMGSFEPPNPASVVEDDELIEPAEDEPKSMFESTKVFIGKRHHQTEKPQDILEFFLKYWTDEDDVVLDPTMGSGSTGVACKKLKRKFIGFELDPKIYEVAKKRIE
jgi:DNA modification methylase